MYLQARSLSLILDTVRSQVQVQARQLPSVAAEGDPILHCPAYQSTPYVAPSLPPSSSRVDGEQEDEAFRVRALRTRPRSKHPKKSPVDRNCHILGAVRGRRARRAPCPKNGLPTPFFAASSCLVRHVPPALHVFLPLLALYVPHVGPVRR